MSDTRLDALDQRIARLEARVEALCAAVGVDAPPVAPPHRAPVAIPPPPPVPTPVEPPATRPQRASLEELLGGRALAIAGGAAVFLGWVFFVALAIRRGLIPVPVRMVLAGLGSGLLVLAGDRLNARRGDRALPAVLVTVGLACGFATLAGSTWHYHLMPQRSVMIIGPLIAGLGVWGSRRLAMQLPAAVGVAGTMLVVLFSDSRDAWDVGFEVGAMAVACALAVGAGWPALWPVSLALIVMTIPDWIWRTSTAAGLSALSVVLAVTLATAVAFDRRVGHRRALHPMLVAMLPISVAFITIQGAASMNGESGHRRVWVSAIALVLLACGAAVRAWRPTRLVGPYIAGLGFVVGAVALALLLDGSVLAVAWAGQAVLGAWVARTLRDDRALYPAVGALLAAAILAATLAPPRTLTDTDAAIRPGLLAWLAVAVTLTGMTLLVRALPERMLPVGGYRVAVVAGLAGLAGLYAASFGIAQALGPTRQSTQLVLSVMWALVGLGVIVTGLVRDHAEWRITGLLLLALAIAKLMAFDLRNLDSVSRAASFILVGVLALGGAFAYHRLRQGRTPGGVAPQ